MAWFHAGLSFADKGDVLDIIHAWPQSLFCRINGLLRATQVISKPTTGSALVLYSTL